MPGWFLVTQRNRDWDFLKLESGGHQGRVAMLGMGRKDKESDRKVRWGSLVASGQDDLCKWTVNGVQ